MLCETVFVLTNQNYVNFGSQNDVYAFMFNRETMTSLCTFM